MPVNIEIKARVLDWERLEARVRQVADGPPRILRQEDTFFRSPRGRLKLRVPDKGAAELIFYDRGDQEEPKPSTYWIAPVPEPSTMIRIFESLLGLRGRVIKTRTLYMAEETRIHLDRVEGLGDFMELEVVLVDEAARPWGVERAQALMAALGIDEGDLVKGAYIDLLESAQGD